MKISFDPGKDEKTRMERGVSLAIGAEVIANQVPTFLDDRCDYGEDRFVSFGCVEGGLFVCAFTVQDTTFQTVSVRKANDRELKKYGR
ncbi:BrnT family toxin [Aminobacter sp. AP02]|uniref:BrnT family toxin n=1 Tax=Aminobacter sp. AP02 TaxID=2135737 RepID=UPI000D6BD2E8|nr:BrnT family toxin [Aminobacter sp. AP02]PWK63866.1 hypothetical protein C8K44_12233 [Aminobacter sp. AP02]